MTIDEWQERLKLTFANAQGAFPLITQLTQKEQQYKGYVEQNFKGHEALTSSFMTFFHDTFHLAWPQLHSVPAQGATEYYSAIFLEYLTNWRSYRATQNLFHHGYPLDGYALLRDTKDRALVMAAIAQGISTYGSASGVDLISKHPGKSFGQLEPMIKRCRKKEEGRIKRLMTGIDSQLDGNTITQLARWENYFHLEVHGSRLTMFFEFEGWFTGKGGIAVVPSPARKPIAMYINRAGEVAWLLLRLLPYLQLEPDAFGEVWAMKWRILDDSVRFYVQYAANDGDRIAGAIVELVKKKFPFTPATSYCGDNG